uniref:INTERB n=2 Tax=Encephalitozoon cuniculi TaxID=6035 RepID=X5LX55_ENCCN|nr:INTERB [Encephalitozoon cuniculi]
MQDSGQLLFEGNDNIAGKGGDDRLSKEKDLLYGVEVCSIILITVLDVIHCSEGLERAVSFIVGLDGQVMVFSFVFRGNNIIVLPTTKYNDLKRNVKNPKDIITSFLKNDISYVLWDFVVGEIVYENDNRLERLFDERMRRYLENASAGVSKVYTRWDKTFSELLEAVRERIFQCDGSGGGHIVKHREDAMNAFDDIIENSPAGISEEERKMYQEHWSSVKEHGESLRNVGRWKQIVEVEKMVCNAFKEICFGLEEEALMRLFAEGRMRKSLKRKVDEDGIDHCLYLEYTVVNTNLLLDAHREYGGEVMKELIKRMLLGKEGKEINRRYINKVANVVKERQRARERESLRPRKRGARQRRRRRVRKRKRRPWRLEEHAGRQARKVRMVGSASRSIEGFFGGERAQRRSRKSWTGEERRKGRFLEEIKKQKMLHDIVDVVSLPKSPDANKFFMDAGEHTKGGSSRGRLVAIGVLEDGRKRMIGVVEVRTFKDRDGCPVVYHLMFWVTGIEELGGVMSPEFAEANDAEKIDSYEERQDESKFVYPPGVAFETVKETGSFQIVCQNPFEPLRVSAV